MRVKRAEVRGRGRVKKEWSLKWGEGAKNKLREKIDRILELEINFGLVFGSFRHLLYNQSTHHSRRKDKRLLVLPMLKGSNKQWSQTEIVKHYIFPITQTPDLPCSIRCMPVHIEIDGENTTRFKMF